MSILPADISTSIGTDAQLVVQVEPSIDMESVTRLQSAIVLATRSGTELSFRIEESESPMSDRTRFRVVPLAPLPDGWSAIRIAELPPPLTADFLHEFDDGSVGARFRPDSWPTIRIVRLCKRDAGSEVHIEVSEAVGPEASVSVVVEKSGITCTHNSDRHHEETLVYDCQGPAEGDLSVRMEADGSTNAVRSFTGETTTLTLSRGSGAEGEPCVMWRPQ